ncbi:hypothetical protein D3C84_566620 [compost metagenome]
MLACLALNDQLLLAESGLGVRNELGYFAAPALQCIADAGVLGDQSAQFRARSSGLALQAFDKGLQLCGGQLWQQLVRVRLQGGRAEWLAVKAICAPEQTHEAGVIGRFEIRLLCQQRSRFFTTEGMPDDLSFQFFSLANSQVKFGAFSIR